jgi:adenylosuccinate lyase
MHSRYDHPLIRKIWEDQQKYLYWVEIETTFLRNLKGKSAIINSIESSDILRIQELEQITKHDIGAFIQWLEEKLTPLIGSDARFVHYGLTSSDIVDTAFSMAIRDSNIIIEKLLEKLVNIIHELAVRYKFNTIVGRTHGQHAEVFPLRQKFMSYHNVLLAFPEQKYYGRLAGSVGNYAYFQPEIAEKTIKSLGLIPSIFNDGQVIHRSVYARYMNEWAVLASVLAKIATDIRLLAQTEVGEFQEDFSDGQVGSSCKTAYIF